MTTTHKTKLFRSVLDCGCSLSLGDFAEEAEFEDVERWLNERGYTLTRREREVAGAGPRVESGRPD
jgi:hypothetical protein